MKPTAETQPNKPKTNRSATDFVESGAPSELRGEIYLTLHTRTAMRVLSGRRGNPKRGIAPIIGLYHFGTRMRDIYRAASEDDPYADRTLVQVEQRFKAANRKLAELVEELEQILEEAQSSQMEVGEFLSMQPRRYRIKTPRYGAQGARLIGNLDRVVRLAFTANHVNQLTRDKMRKYIDQAGHEVRSTFAQQENYAYLGITRLDGKQQTQRWQMAVDQMGELEEEFLAAATKPVFGPATREMPMTSALFTPEEDRAEEDPEAYGEVAVEEVPADDAAEVSQDEDAPLEEIVPSVAIATAVKS